MHRYFVTDVFTASRFNGAQVAVFPDAQPIDPELRARIAEELSLWASVFVEPGESPNQFRTRTYTPFGEAPFGSHTALAAATALRETGVITGDAPVVFASNEGRMHVFVEQDASGAPMTRLAQTIEAHTDRWVPESDELAQLLSLDASQIGCGDYRPLFANVERNYLIIPVRDYGCVRAAEFNVKRWATSNALSMATYEAFVFARGGTDTRADFHGRLFGPDIGRHEDPPVGGAVGAFVAYLCAHEHVRKGTQAFTLERGHPRARVSTIEVEMDNKGASTIALRVGGRAVISARGEIVD